MTSATKVSHIADRWMNNKAGFTPFMVASEPYFILAEVIERNMVSGNGQQAYETGVTLALMDNSISQDKIDAYLAEPSVAWGPDLLGYNN